MQEWTLACFDHKTAPWVAERLEIYQKRLSYWVRFRHKIIKPNNDLDQNQAQLADALKHLSTLADNRSGLLIVLDETGKKMDSMQFSKHCNSWLDRSVPVNIIVGPSYGLHESWKDKAHEVLSLSPLTLTHDFAQLLIAEQLYRAMTILHHRPYHIA